MHHFFKYLYSLKIPFFKRLIPSLIKRIFFFNKTQIIQLNFTKIKLDLTQAIDREIYLKGHYEKKQLDFLDENRKKNEIKHFFDIGANIGYYSLYFNNIDNVYAFEPNKKSLKRLEENNRLNNFNIKIYGFGLSNSTSEREIWYTNKDKMGGSAIFDQSDLELKKYDPKNIIKEKISTKKLDEILNINKSQILVKIDVERHEKNVLEGMKKIIQNNNIFMQIEIGEQNKNEIFNYLKELNLKWINSIGHDHYFIKDLNN